MPLDPISITTVFNCLSEELLNIVNHSLFTGTSPDSLKTAMFGPLLKKTHLDSSFFSNYQTISNLTFLKDFEEVVSEQVTLLFKTTVY